MWYVKFSETEVKRGSLEQLQALIAKGRITRATLVKASANEAWVAAGDVVDLYAEPLDPFDTVATPTALGATPLAATPTATSGDSRKLLIYGGIGACCGLAALVAFIVFALGGTGNKPAPLIASPTPAVAPPPAAAPTSGMANVDPWIPNRGSNGKTTQLIPLLERITPERHTFQGTIRKEEGKLYTAGNKPDVARFDMKVPAEYTLDITVRPKSRPESLHVGLVVDGKQTAFLVDAFLGSRTGIFSINGRGMTDPEYPGVYNGSLLTLNEPTKLKICVTPRSVAAWADGRPVFRWEGKASDLDWKLPYAAPDKPCLLLGSWDCKYEITQWVIIEGVHELPDLRTLQVADPRASQRRKTDQVSAPPQRAEMKLPELANLVEPSIVRLDVKSPLGEGVGSGFIIADGVVITNLHVVAGGKVVKLTFVDKSSLDAEAIVAIDRDRDLAIVRYDSSRHKAPPLPLAKELPGVGVAVAAFGAPQGLSFTMTNGIVSALRNGRDLLEYGARFSGSLVQTSAPISPGNSGGPLVDMHGRVVGVNTVQLRSGQNLNFAVSSIDIEDVYANARVKLQNKQNLGRYVREQDMVNLFQIEKQQQAAMTLTAPTQTEWVINGRPAQATMVLVQTAEEKTRSPEEFRATDFVKGKYLPPTALRVRLKGANGKEVDMELAALDAAGQQRVRDRWLAEAQLAIKKQMVARGNGGMRRFILSASNRSDDPETLLKIIYSTLYVAEQVLPKADADQIRTFVMQNIDLLGAELSREEIEGILKSTEAQFRSSVTTNPKIDEEMNEILQNLLVETVHRSFELHELR